MSRVAWVFLNWKNIYFLLCHSFLKYGPQASCTRMPRKSCRSCRFLGFCGQGLGFCVSQQETQCSWCTPKSESQTVLASFWPCEEPQWRLSPMHRSRSNSCHASLAVGTPELLLGDFLLPRPLPLPRITCAELILARGLTSHFPKSWHHPSTA